MANRGKADIELASLNQQQIAWICGVTSRSIRDWADAPRNSDGTYNAQDFIAWFLKRSTLSDDQREFNNQRERLAAAQAEKVEAENRIRRGELVDAHEVIAEWQNVLSAMRAKLLSMPSKLGPQLVSRDDPAKIAHMIKTEVYQALDELSEYRRAEPTDPEATAEPDGKRVG
jgi:phage terminase Nu1 subunit (DNA packaging protein)